MEKKYRLTPPNGILMPKEWMTEKEIREFAPSLVGEESMIEVWKEKIQKDSFTEIIQWLSQSGFQIEEK